MIYLDHAAATPVSRHALEAMLPFLSEQFFNPSSPYLPAKRAREAYEQAKSDIAHCLGAKSTDLIITSGATEANNLAFATARKWPNSSILALATEHASVLEAASVHGLEKIAVDHTGLIDLGDLSAKLTDSVVIVSVALANNELGVIQPLSEIAGIIRSVRHDRLQRGITRPLYLHTDASQAQSLLDLNVSRLGVDMMTLGSAKVGGPKGVGALYLARDIEPCPLAYGGGQERGVRPGTENVAGVVGFAAALSDAHSRLNSSRKHYQEMANLFRQELAHNSIVAQNPDFVKFIGNRKHQLASFIPVCFPGLDAERLIYKLEQQEIYLSTGAACAANKGSKSHVLAAIGLSDAEIAGSLRISLGSTNKLEDMPAAAHAIVTAVSEEYARIYNLEKVTTCA